LGSQLDGLEARLQQREFDLDASAQQFRPDGIRSFEAVAHDLAGDGMAKFQATTSDDAGIWMPFCARKTASENSSRKLRRLGQGTQNSKIRAHAVIGVWIDRMVQRGANR
jgi:hypothetical protein